MIPAKQQQQRDPKMGQQSTFHAPHGGADFLGWRKRAGETEIVYDDGVTRRMIWRVAAAAGSEGRMWCFAARSCASGRHSPRR